MKIELPGGQAATLWTKEEIPHGRRKPLLHMAQEKMASGNRELGIAELDLAVRCLVRSWTLLGPGGEVLPIPWENADLLDDLPGPVVDALYRGVSQRFNVMVPDVIDPKSGDSSVTPAIPA